MICYRDMTFCPFHNDCLSGKDCPRSLTEEVRRGAEAWWGKDDAPICVYADKPWCFEAKFVPTGDQIVDDTGGAI